MAPEFAVVSAAVGAPFAAAVVVPVVYRLLGERTAYVGALVALASFALVATQVGSEGTVAVDWVPAVDVALRFSVDGWAVLFALLATGIGVLIFVYSASYMHGEENLRRYYATLLAFMGSIVGVAFAGDLVVLFVFWELTSVCSFVLIGHHSRDPDSQYAARMAMLVTVGGGLCLLAGIVLLALVASGPTAPTFDLTAMLADGAGTQAALRDAGVFSPVLVLFTLAAGAKSAQVPLHFWLPNAMVAPTPVSAFLHSATMVKVGVYVFGRLRPMFSGAEWTTLVVTVGLVTMLVGALLAVRAEDSKRLLAYSTASHLGLMVAGFGFGSAYGAEAGAFHLLNHGLFKAALFLVAGIVAHEVGTRHVPALGGLWRDLPVTAAVAGVAGLSMAGIPPFAGFYSKELLFEAAWEGAHAAGGLAWLAPAVAVVASACTVLYSLRFLAMFWGERTSAVGAVDRPPLALVGPPALLAAGVAFVSLAPGVTIDALVQAAVDATATGSPAVHVGLPTAISGPVAMSMLSIGGGLAAYPVVGRIATAVDRLVALPLPIRPSTWYREGLAGLERASGWLAPRIHSELLRTYASWVLGSTSGLVLLGYGVGRATPATVDLGGVPVAVGVVLAVAVIATVALVVAGSHVAGVLTLSILGFMVAIFYILASGPDLALTQLVVETLLLLIFLLVLEELPEFYADLDPGVALRDVALAVFVGAGAFVTVLATVPGDGGLSVLARYYTEHAVEGGGGTNVVNVILTDFRVLDTLGELLVVALAAMAVLVLLRMRTRGETR